MLYKSHKKFLEIQGLLAKKVASSVKKPKVTVIAVGSDRATASFVSIKKKFADALGIPFDILHFDVNTNTQDLIKEIEKVASDKVTTALIVQLPLPKEIDTEKVLASIPRHLDADVLSPGSYQLFISSGIIMPPVAKAIMTIFDDLGIDLNNKNIVVVGMGRLVGGPVYDLLKKQALDVTCIDINTASNDRQVSLKKADIIISGIGVSHSIGPEDIKSGAILIDAGTSEQAGVLAGDIDPACAAKAASMTSVPGGVGPLTIACLFSNIVELQEQEVS